LERFYTEEYEATGLYFRDDQPAQELDEAP
jgi:hypothetical protein